MKNKLFFCLIISFLCGCNGNDLTPTPSEQKPTVTPTNQPTIKPSIDPTIEQTIEPTIEPTVEPTVVTSEPEPTIDVSTKPYFEGYIFDDSILKYEELEIGVNDSYNIRKSVINEFKDSWMNIYIDNMDFATADVYDNINGFIEGVCEVNVVFDETYFDRFTLKVMSQEYINENFKFDYARLHEKSFTVFGASNSDITVKPSSYEQRQTLWCEQLVSRYDMTMYNYAKSGSTAGYCKGFLGNNSERITIVGTYIINQKKIIDSIENSDYVFFNFGGNDTTYSCELGEVGEVNEDNYLQKESFKGSYSYMIDKVRSINPNIKVICKGMTPSTWAAPTYSRVYMDEIIKEIAQEKKCKYVYLLGLWEDNEFSKYCPDGTHPLTIGHELLVERLISQ